MIVIMLLFLCLLTCILETVALLFMRKKEKKWLRSALVCNVITNPILNMILPAVDLFIRRGVRHYSDGFLVSGVVLLALELGVIFLETWIFGFFMNEPYRRRLKTSFVMNAFSFIVGLILNVPIAYLFFELSR